MLGFLAACLFFLSIIGFGLYDMHKPKPAADPILDARRRRYTAASAVITSYYVGESYRRHLRNLSPLEQRQIQSDLTVIATSWSNAVGEQPDAINDVWML